MLAMGKISIYSEVMALDVCVCVCIALQRRQKLWFSSASMTK